jgi:Domain of unknown function (DUF3395)
MKLVHRTLAFTTVLLTIAGMVTSGCKPKPAPKPVDNKLVIVKAVWSDMFDEHMVDVTKIVAGSVKDNALQLVATSQVLGDPAAFKIKHLRVEWSKGGIVVKKHARENETLTIAANEQPVPIRLVVRKAIYGNLASGKTRDVTMNVADLVKDNTLSITPNNALLGDPSPGQAKQLSVDYTFDGLAKSKIADETHPLVISATGQ